MVGAKSCGENHSRIVATELDLWNSSSGLINPTEEAVRKTTGLRKMYVLCTGDICHQSSAREASVLM